ncbi:MAG: pyruvate dehydrogenase complex E1 component subunit beta [Deltaproteobacteria bacterium]|nr:pyruvate dehydrogenase complex E1 component subunit beta [Deltaproteobacteria bacterium]
MALLSYRDALNQALHEEFARDDKVILLGEEVAQYQGAFKVSAGLLQKFGEKRVIDTPISEAGFVGMAIGAACLGIKPIAEVMTFNFAILALDQMINNAAKMLSMSGGQLSVPLVLRGPGGAAHQLASQHSQALESQYAMIPGLKVVLPATPADAKGLLKSAIRDPNPVVFIEGEALYPTKGEVPDGEYVIPIGKADIKRAGKDVTLIAWSRMTLVTLEAARLLEAEGIDAEVVDLRTVRPVDREAILTSVRKTNRAVVIEEAWPWATVGASIVDLIQREAFDDLDAPVLKLNGVDAPMPYAKNLEHAMLPNPDAIAVAAKKVLYR